MGAIAEGRSNRVESSLRGKMEVQKRSVTSVAGIAPWLAVGVVGSFADGTLRVDAYDPADFYPKLEPIDYPVDEAEFLLSYYRPFLAALEFGQAEAPGPVGFTTVNIWGFASVGLSDVLIHLLQGSPHNLVERIKEHVYEGRWPDDPGIKGDGSFMNVDWVEAMAVNDIEW